MKFLLATLGLLLCMAVPASADLVHSFEAGSLDGWTALASTKVTNKAVASGTTGDGVPATAITDGTYALAMTHDARTAGGEIGLMRINNAETAWFTALKDPDAVSMSIDVFVKGSAINTGSWSQVGLRLQGGGFAGIDTTAVFIKTDGVFLDQTVTVDMDLTGVDLTVASWAQVTFLTNGNPANLLSPIYADNYRIVTAVTAVPETSAFAMMSAVSLLCGVVLRRRVR